jgi:ABC-type uncharacterized transport system permease subunit
LLRFLWQRWASAVITAEPPSTYALITTLTPGAESHILLSILAYSVLTIAAAQALLIAIQDRQFRTHKRA